MSMRDLVAAGAPELPEGWFYRVREALGVGFQVEIREQRRFTSREVAHTWVHENRHDDMTAAVVEACQRAYAYAGEQADAETKRAALSKLVGDHDPKGGR